MNILSVDTATEILSIALRTDSSYEERMIKGNFSHSEDLLSEILSLLERAKIELRDLDLLVCTKGPGSFTGLRVGMASLKGIRSGSDAKLVSVPTLNVMIRAVGSRDIPVLAVIDAKKKKFYMQAEKEGKILVSTRDGNPDDISDFIAENERILITGQDAEKFLSKIEDESLRAKFIIDDMAPRNLSRALIALGLETLERDGEDEIGEGPLYIRRSDAEEALLKKIKEKENENN